MRVFLLLVSVLASNAANASDAAKAGDAAGEVTQPIDERAVLRRLPVDHGWLDVVGDLGVPARGWTRIDHFAAAPELLVADEVDGRHWRGTMLDGRLRVRQTLSREGREGTGGDALRITLEVDESSDPAAPGAADHEPVQWMLDLPTAAWAGGTWRVDDRSGTLPATLHEGSPHLDSRGGSRIELGTADGTSGVVVRLPAGSAALLQDGRGWGNSFNLYLPLARGADGRWSLSFTIAATGTIDHAPAAIVVGAAGVAGATHDERIAGLGGNWCFDIDGPTTVRSRALLRSGWARTEMDLSRLPEPQADAEPAAWATEALAALDGAHGEAADREHLALTGAFAGEHVTVLTSLWRAPDWMLEPPVRESGNHIAAERWRWFTAAATAWLARARAHGGEPAYFAFNEPDWGVRIKLTPVEQRDAIVRLGAAFAAAGLRTRLAAGDITNARDTIAYVRPSVEDAQARRYIGCIAVHSWGGATPAQWGAWRAYATGRQLPLVISEVGPDAEAWRYGAFRARRYQVAEAEHLLGILRDARPDAALRWEFTGDYDPFDGERPTMRYSVWRWAIAALPVDAAYRACSSDRERVLAVAATVGDGGSLLLVNTGWRRAARISGLPRGSYHAAMATPEAPWSRLPDVTIAGVTGDATTLDLPADAFVVLTTAALPATWDEPAH